MMQNSYQLIAKLKGHKNDFAPSICYVPQSNCIVSAEKHCRGNNTMPNTNSLPKASDPTSNPNPRISNAGASSYQEFTSRH